MKAAGEKIPPSIQLSIEFVPFGSAEVEVRWELAISALVEILLQADLQAEDELPT